MNEDAEYAQRRVILVDRQLVGRGFRDPRLLRAFRDAPRERFVAGAYRNRACEDAPVPDADGGTLATAWSDASALAALAVTESDRALIVGASPGYGAALLAELASDVSAVEAGAPRAEAVRRRLVETGYARVRVREGDPAAGWPSFAPYDAIVATGVGEPPKDLLGQLADGGRLVTVIEGRLVRFRRVGSSQWSREDLGSASRQLEEVMPAFGASLPSLLRPRSVPPPEAPDRAAVNLLRDSVRPFSGVGDDALDELIDELSGATVVMLGESTHGTAEFYRLRARVTHGLVARGFDLLALEADWPDAAVLDRQVRGLPPDEDPTRAFTRFPDWMWRNVEVEKFARQLGASAATIADPSRRVRVIGLDLFSLHRSLERVADWLEVVDPDAAARARGRYGCVLAWEGTPAWRGGWRPDCGDDVAAVLAELRAAEATLGTVDPEGYVEAVGNARAVVAVERYHRCVGEAGSTAWNTREAHMIEVLGEEMTRRGPNCRAVVWAHNSHVGDARANDMGLAGQRSLGELARLRWGDRVRLVGLGTSAGEVAAAPAWDAPVRYMRLPPPITGSHDALFHATGHRACHVTIRGASADLLEVLGAWRPQRAVGVVYDPDAEPARHYIRAALAPEFDAWVWVERSHGVRPLAGPRSHRDPETWPSGL